MVEVTSPSELAAVAERLRGLAAGLDPTWVTAREAPALWSRLEDIRRLASGAQVALADLVDKSPAPAKAGLRNGAEWIAQQSGGSLRSAYDAVTTSKRLGDLPDVTAALRDGRVSAIQASVIADAATVDPSTAERLVDMAQKTSLGELRREALRIKAAADPDPDKTEDRIRRERRLRWFVDNEGAFNLSGRGPLKDGSELAAVLGPIIDDIFTAAHEAGGITQPREAYTWDGLVEMARMAYAWMHGLTADTPTQPDTNPDTDAAPTNHPANPNPAKHTNDQDDDAARGAGDAAANLAGSDAEATSPTDVSSTPAAGAAHTTGTGRVGGAGVECSEPRLAGMDTSTTGGSSVPVQAPSKWRPRSSGPNPWGRIIMRIDWSALVRGNIEGEETCDIVGLGPVPVSVAREVLGQANLDLVITKGRDVATYTYLGRGMNTAQRIAALWNQPECQREGCHRPVREWDHRQPYAQNPVTHIGNMDGLCTPDHLLKSRDGWELIDGVGKRPMVPPDDPRHPKNQGSRPRDKPHPNPIAA